MKSFLEATQKYGMYFMAGGFGASIWSCIIGHLSFIASLITVTLVTLTVFIVWSLSYIVYRLIRKRVVQN